MASPYVEEAAKRAAKIGISVPTVHLNGTSGGELFEQVINALSAVRHAVTALQAASPNARDYYVQGGGMEIFYKAQREHEKRMHRLADVISELQVIAEAIDA